MTDKLTRQQRRKLARSEKKNQRKTVSAFSSRNTNSNQLMFNEQKTNPIKGTSSYKPSSKSPCYLIEADNSKTVWKGGWVPPGSMVEIAGRIIPGMVYVGKPPNSENLSGVTRYPNQIYIDPDLEIIDAQNNSRQSIVSKARTYDKISPADRGAYLDWLATSKTDRNYDPAYMTMYYMGLEYRYFIDQKDQFNPDEVRAIIKEIDHLMALYQPNPIKQKLMQFRRLIFYETVQTQISDSGVFINFGDIDTVIPFSGGTRLINGLPLENSAVLYIFRKHLTQELKEVYETCRYVFERQFETKLNQLHPGGLQIPIPNEYLYKSYTALFEDFVISELLIVNGKKIPDITCSEELKNITISIGTEVAKELQPYCDELKQNILNINSKREIEFLPDLGPNSAKHNADKLLKEWADEKYNQSEPVLYRDILSLFKDETSKEMNSNQWYQTLVALHRVGYGVAPDLLSLLVYENADIEVKLFKYKSDFNDRTKSSGYYHTELFAMIMGFEIFQIDPKLSKRHLSILKQRLDYADKLTESEKERVVANFERFQRVSYNHIVFEIASKSYNIDTQIIRDTLKFYAEQDKSVISNNLDQIVYFYKIFNIDVSLIKTDFHLTNKAEREYLQLIDD